jgi:hypothetical protein
MKQLNFLNINRKLLINLKSKFMKKVLLISALVFLGFAKSFAFTVIDVVASPYSLNPQSFSHLDKTTPCNLTNVTVTGQTTVTQTGTAVVNCTIALKRDGVILSQRSTDYCISGSWAGTKQKSWSCGSSSYPDGDPNNPTTVWHTYGEYFISVNFHVDHGYEGNFPGEVWAMAWY